MYPGKFLENQTYNNVFKKDLWVFVCVYICLKDWKRALDSPEAGVLCDFKSFTVDAGASPLIL